MNHQGSADNKQMCMCCLYEKLQGDLLYRMRGCQRLFEVW